MQGIFFNDFNNAYIPEILKELYRDKVYAEYIERHGRKDLEIIDCGGNVGLFTYYVYPYAKRIYTIEPSKQHLDVLNYMLEFNKMTDKVTVIPKALANENGNLKFYHNTNTTMFSLKENVNNKPDEIEEVEAITVDTLFTQYNVKHIDFLKLDVEGSESEIIGGNGFEQVADKIDSLVVEYHAWSNTNPNQLVNTLRDYGFDVKKIPTQAVLFGAKRK